MNSAEYAMKEAINCINTLRQENTKLTKQLETSTQFPYKIGDTLWTIEYDDDGNAVDVVSGVFIGGNDKFAFLSPTIYNGSEELNTAQDICRYYYDEYLHNSDYCSCAIVAYTECFRSAVEARKYAEDNKKLKERLAQYEHVEI